MPSDTLVATLLIVAGSGALATVVLLGIRVIRDRGSRTPQEPVHPDEAATTRTVPVPALRDPLHRRSVAPAGAVEHTGADESWGRELHAMVVERDTEPAAPLDPDEQAWAAQVTEFRAALGRATDEFARALYRLAEDYAWCDLMTTTGSIPRITDQDLHAWIAGDYATVRAVTA